MTITARQTKLLHVAKRQIGLDDETYRLALVKIAGVTTSKDLTQEGFTAVMGMFEYCGFRPFEASGKSYGKRKGFATPAQVELIRTLWMEIHRERALDEDALNGWLLKFHKVSSLRFLTEGAAPKVITGLKAWKNRAK